jgi:hypothetical protein
MGDTEERMPLSDTSPEAWAQYYRRLAEMTPAERINIAVSLWEAADSIQRAAMRRRYPDADDEEISFQIAVTRFGPELARKAYKRQ